MTDESRESLTPNPESQGEYTVFLSNTRKDPFEADHVFYRVLQSMHYPIDFKEGATDRYGNPLEDDYQVLVDSTETKQKTSSLRDFVLHTDTYGVLFDTGNGQVYSVMSILSPQAKNISTQVWEDRYKIKTLNREDPRTKIALEKCFLRAVLISVNRMRKTRSYGDQPDSLEKAWKNFSISFPEDTKLYEELTKPKDGEESGGLEPIDPEQMGGMLVPIIQQYLEEHPDLKLPLMENGKPS